MNKPNKSKNIVKKPFLTKCFWREVKKDIIYGIIESCKFLGMLMALAILAVVWVYLWAKLGIWIVGDEVGVLIIGLPGVFFGWFPIIGLISWYKSLKNRCT